MSGSGFSQGGGASVLAMLLFPRRPHPLLPRGRSARLPAHFLGWISFFLGLRDCVSLSLRWELSARVDLLCPSLAAFLKYVNTLFSNEKLTSHAVWGLAWCTQCGRVRVRVGLTPQGAFFPGRCSKGPLIRDACRDQGPFSDPVHCRSRQPVCFG